MWTVLVHFYRCHLPIPATNSASTAFPISSRFLNPAAAFYRSAGSSGTPFRLYGTASVGSQTLTGIPRLHELRFAPEFAQRSVIWPFETGWATKAKWLREGVSIVHAEIFPSLREPLADAIKDRGQVRSTWDWACELDRQGLLWFEFARPIEIDPGSPEDVAVQLTEGWILGSSPTVRHQ